MSIKLFLELITGTIFYFYDQPRRKLIKSDQFHYIAPEGPHQIHPYVAVFPEYETPLHEWLPNSRKEKKNDTK